MLTNESERHINELYRSALRAGIKIGICASHVLLNVRQEQSAADALMVHFDSVVNRAMSMFEAEIAIDDAKRMI